MNAPFSSTRCFSVSSVTSWCAKNKPNNAN
jgi:hypothetical protein